MKKVLQPHDQANGIFQTLNLILSLTPCLYENNNLNSYLMNGFPHHYQMGESCFIFRSVRNDFHFLSHFSIKFLYANRIAPDGTPHSEVSHLGLCCLLMSHKRDARLQ